MALRRWVPSPLSRHRTRRVAAFYPEATVTSRFHVRVFFPVVLQEEREGKKREKGWLVGVAG